MTKRLEWGEAPMRLIQAHRRLDEARDRERELIAAVAEAQLDGDAETVRLATEARDDAMNDYEALILDQAHAFLFLKQWWEQQARPAEDLAA